MREESICAQYCVSVLVWFRTNVRNPIVPRVLSEKLEVLKLNLSRVDLRMGEEGSTYWMICICSIN